MGADPSIVYFTKNATATAAAAAAAAFLFLNHFIMFS